MQLAVKVNRNPIMTTLATQSIRIYQPQVVNSIPALNSLLHDLEVAEEKQNLPKRFFFF